MNKSSEERRIEWWNPQCLSRWQWASCRSCLLLRQRMWTDTGDLNPWEAWRTGLRQGSRNEEGHEAVRSAVRSVGQGDNTEWVPCACGPWADDRVLALRTLPSCCCFCSISQNALPLVWRLTGLTVNESNRLRVDPCRLQGKLQDQGTSKITKQFQNYGLTNTEGGCRGREGSKGTGIQKNVCLDI